MCKIMEDMRNEAAKKAVLETAERMIKKGKMSLKEIADYVPALSLDELKELESEVQVSERGNNMSGGQRQRIAHRPSTIQLADRVYRM